MKRICSSLLLAALVWALAGCYVLRIEKPVADKETFELRQHFFLLGLVGEYDIDLQQECPRGVGTFGDKFTIWDILLTVASVGVYTPKTVVLSCAS